MGPSRTSHMHDTYYADNQANRFSDDKDQCDGKSADSRRKSMHWALGALSVRKQAGWSRGR